MSFKLGMMFTMPFLFSAIAFASSQHLDVQRIIAKHNLHHGDPCSWKSEKYRQNFIKRLNNTENILYSGGFAKLAGSLVNSLAGSNHQFCNPAEMLVCDRRSRKCICGDFVYEALEGKDSSRYVLESSGKCRWNAGTTCMPDMSNNPIVSMASRLGLQVDYGCKTGTSCKTRNGEICTEEAITQILRDQIENSTRKQIQLAWNGIKSGKMCFCKADRFQKKNSHWVYRKILGVTWGSVGRRGSIILEPRPS